MAGAERSVGSGIPVRYASEFRNASMTGTRSRPRSEHPSNSSAVSVPKPQSLSKPQSQEAASRLGRGQRIGVASLTSSPLALHDDAEGVCGALRRVWDVWREQKDLSCAHAHQPALATLDNRQLQLSLLLPEELGATLEVEVSACVGPSHAHDREHSLVQQLVAHWRHQGRRIRRAPAGQQRARGEARRHPLRSPPGLGKVSGG
eukprot:scaffold87298_cov35-Tisochrysis_lutea.AAC.1